MNFFPDREGYFHLIVFLCYLLYTQIITIMWHSPTYLNRVLPI